MAVDVPLEIVRLVGGLVVIAVPREPLVPDPGSVDASVGLGLPKTVELENG